MISLRIAVILLCFNMSLAWVVSTGFFPGYTTDTRDFSYTEINNTIPSQDKTAQNINQYLFGDFLSTMLAFVTLVGYSTVLLPIMLSKFNLPPVIYGLFLFLTYGFYSLAIIQFLANRSEKLMG